MKEIKSVQLAGNVNANVDGAREIGEGCLPRIGLVPDWELFLVIVMRLVRSTFYYIDAACDDVNLQENGDIRKLPSFGWGMMVDKAVAQ